MNKKQTGIYNQWLRSNNLNLYDCYKRPSEYKLNAEYSIVQSCLKLHGKRFRILAYNTYSFTCAFQYENEGKTFLVYHTPYHTEAFEIPADRKEVI